MRFADTPSDLLCHQPVRLQTGIAQGEPADSHSLSPRETQVLTLVAGGTSNKEIAQRLGISVHTVKRHMGNVFDKLDDKLDVRKRKVAARIGLGNEPRRDSPLQET